MTTWNLTALLRLFTEAGAIALDHFDRPTTSYKEDDTVVTQADREIEQFLGREFDRPEEDSYLIGEETVSKRDESYIASALRETAWVVDPIDGTILYANHLDDWGISIGLMQQGTLTEGAVYFPLSGEIAITDAGRLLSGVVDRAVLDPLEQAAAVELAPVPSPRRGYSKGGIIAVTQELTRERRIPFENPVYAGGSAVYPLVALARGNMMAYVGKLKLWDFAGCLPILLNSGAVVTLEDGSPLGGEVDGGRYRLDPEDLERFATMSNLVIALDDGVHERIREALDGVPEPA